MMKNTIPDAVYHAQTLKECQYNPFVEALPKKPGWKEMILRLSIRPPYSEEDRHCAIDERLSMTQRILRVHYPREKEVKLFEKIDKCIRWGYADRNPFTRQQIEQMKKISGDSTPIIDCHFALTYGFSLLGISGIGKTTSVETIMSYYPQVIRHTCYNGTSFAETQLVWVKIDCWNNRPKSLCLSFFKAVDHLLGTNYASQSSHRTQDVMMTQMAQICETFHVGILIIDEIQHLCTGKREAAETILDFLVSIVNELGIPVITIGTPKALPLFQSDFQQAKRFGGQGTALWERMSDDDSEWGNFCREIWRYQYLQNKVALTEEMQKVLYDESLGIPFLAVHIYKLAQENAIMNGKEIFDAKDLRKASREDLKLTNPMREAMRSGREVDMEKFKDISPFSAADYEDHYSIAGEVQNPAKDPESGPAKTPLSPEEYIRSVLLMIGAESKDALAVAEVIAARHAGSRVSIQSLAAEACSLYCSLRKAPEEEKSAVSGKLGYQELSDAGLIDNDRKGNADGTESEDAPNVSDSTEG